MENRLVWASGPTNTGLYYAPLGRLAANNYFLYDGDNLVGEYDGSAISPRGLW
jgi:hypothetical protein